MKVVQFIRVQQDDRIKKPYMKRANPVIP